MTHAPFLVRAFLDSVHSYGQISCALVEELQRRKLPTGVRLLGMNEYYTPVPEPIKRAVTVDVRGFDWVVESGQPGKLTLQQIVSPGDFTLQIPSTLPSPRRRNTIYTMWESTRLRPEWVKNLNAYDTVFVPNAWNANCFSASGVTAPIQVVPLFVDHTVFKPTPLPASDIVVFGSAGRMAHGGVRKGLGFVLEAFQKAFPKRKYRDVRLRLKLWPDCPFNASDDFRIDVTKAYMPPERLCDWFRSLHVYVSGSTAEGWGLFPCQALACGRPVMAAQFAGHAEFFDGTVGYPVEYRLGPAQGLYTDLGHWADLDFDSAVDTFRKIYEDRKGLKARAATAPARVAPFTVKRFVSTLMDHHRIIWGPPKG